MDWFYEKDGGQNGPVEVSDLTRMLEAGELSLSTLVWRKGMEDWKPMGEVDVLKNDLDEEMAVCAYSGDVKPKSELVPYGKKWVSLEHKEEFVQQLMEGAQVNHSEDGNVLDYEVRISQYLGQAWELLAGDFWPIIGVSAAINGGYMIVTQVPFVGVAAALVSTPIFAGLFYYFLLKVRRQEARFEDSLSGFNRNFLQLFLLGLIQMVVTMACLIPGGIIVAVGAWAIEGVSDVVGISIIIAGIVLVLLAAVYLSTIWMFSNWLCIDRKMEFWSAMMLSMKAVHRHWFGCFLFLLAVSVLNIAGMMAVCVGIFFTFPWTMLATAYFYEDVFGRRRLSELGSIMD